MSLPEMKDRLEGLYEKFNQRRYVHPDPLECVYEYDDPADREIAALIAASLAYGQVRQILKSVSDVLSRMGPSPYAYLMDERAARIQSDMAGFVHRFARGAHVAALLTGIRKTLKQHGSLQQSFRVCLADDEPTIWPALCRFSETLRHDSACGAPGHLLACPEKGSACKRLNLFLRWMVRKDRVDPGGWPDVPASMLIIPLDTHMFRICRKLGLTARNQPNMRTAIEITEAFRQWAPQDPVKYDFTLSRFGIRKDLAGQADEYFA
ncbi:MAG: TIGR02757 family protein [Desulfobacterales bacterium]|nr:TIGR02757 family protein [Desulfobacterales bacterium]